MATHLIVGAGAVGTAAARHLTQQGHEVRIVTRSGSGPVGARIEHVAADATDARRLTELAADVSSIVNAANPPYHRWVTDWPPLAAAMLDAAEHTGARLVIMSNLYGFARGASPMAASDPLDPPTQKGRVRVDMWETALERHRRGRISAVEVRASDFVGPGLGDGAHLGGRFVDAVLRGRSPRVVGRPDVPHSWTYVDDVGRMLAVAATDDRAPGRAWHVVTEPPRTAQEMADALADVAGTDRVTVRGIPPALLRVAGWFSPLVREVRDMTYQFTDPFVIDDGDTVRTFGVEPTPLDEQLAAVVDAARTGSTDITGAAVGGSISAE